VAFFVDTLVDVPMAYHMTVFGKRQADLSDIATTPPFLRD